MINGKEKFKRYLNEISNAGLPDFFNGIENYFDSALDGNTDFLMSTFEEYVGKDKYLFEGLKYDDFTKKAIYRFMIEMDTFFPGILTHEEMIDRISNSLRKSIIVGKIRLKNNNSKKEVFYDSYYDYDKKLIYLDKDNTSAKIDSVLFHEFVHCLTIDKENTGADVDSEFLTETVPSLMQNIIESKLYHSKERCNNYIINYALQLNIVAGFDFFKEYIRNFRDISNIFKDYPIRDYSNTEILHNYVVLVKAMNRVLRVGGDAKFLKYLNSIFEFNTVLFLNTFFKNHPALSDEEKLSRMTKLINLQKTPDIDLYKSILDEINVDKSTYDRFPELKYLKYNEASDNLDPVFLDKVNNFNASKCFGFIDLINYTSNPMLCKKNVFYSYGKSYYSDYLENEEYYNLMFRLKNEYNISLSGYKISEVIGEKENDSVSMGKEMQEGADFTNEKLASYRKKNADRHHYMFRASQAGHTVYIEKNSDINIFTEKDVKHLIDDNRSGESRAFAYLYSNGINRIYTSNDTKDIIGCDDTSTYVLRYKPLKGQYEVESYRAHAIDDVNKKGDCLSKKI